MAYGGNFASNPWKDDNEGSKNGYGEFGNP
jgi:hypothetical protein